MLPHADPEKKMAASKPIDSADHDPLKKMAASKAIATVFTLRKKEGCL